MEGKKRPVWEIIVLAVILVLTITLVGSTYSSQQKFEKQKNLHHQLQLLRTAVLLYKSVNKTNPIEIAQITEGTFTLPEETLTRHYVEHAPKLSNGKLTDPFGNPYAYDPETGWIKSSTPGYDFW